MPARQGDRAKSLISLAVIHQFLCDVRTVTHPAMRGHQAEHSLIVELLQCRARVMSETLLR